MSKKLVKSEETRPCGCHVVTYSDDTAVLTPCLPCGLAGAAESLMRAGQALGAVAARIRAEQNEVVIQRAVKR